MKFVDLENLQVYDEEIKEYLKQKISEFSDEIIIQEDSFLKFPTVGNKNTLYIDTTSNKSYRWDDINLKYFQLDYDNFSDVKIIDGCGYSDSSEEVTNYNLITDESGNFLTDELGNYLCLEV